MRTLSFVLLLTLVLCTAAIAQESEPAGGHHDPIVPVLAALCLLLVSAKVGGELFERLGQPSVLGELVAGIVLGNMVLLNPAWTFFEPLRAGTIAGGWAEVIDAFARIGVILLLFEVGLESTVSEMRKVGIVSTLVAVIGVITPFSLGYGVSMLFIREVPSAVLAMSPDFDIANIHLFIGAVLCATSVGITARVFRDLGRIQMPEAKIVLGAAVVDDVLGLVILSIVAGIITAAETGTAISVGSIAMITVIAFGFLAVAVVLGGFIVPRYMNLFARFKTSGVMITAALLFCLVMAYLANLAGLAPIVGAFAAGLILEPVHFTRFKEEYELEELLTPITTILVPLFFVLMGIQVRLETFANMNVLGIALGLTLAAIIGKQACGLVVGKGLNRGLVGVGMIPRGEVGLIFAGIGKQLKVVDDAIFSAIVIMVILTTFVTPPVLAALIRRADRKR